MCKFRKPIFLLISLALIICLLAGCGATVSTTLTVDTNFAGQRVIAVKIDNSDLSESVTGGIEALKSVADDNLPEQMSCTQSSDDTSATLTFTIDFNNLDDYREKVNALIAKGSNTELVPEVQYENLNTVFKSGIYLQENFTSFDLLQWYFDVVQTSGIVTHEDTSEWYELGESKIIIDGTEYSSYSELSLDERETCCVDTIKVETFLNIDGTFKRIFNFQAYDSTVEALAQKNCNLSTYISNLTPENDVFEESTDSYIHEYKITVSADSVEQLVQKTDTILQTKNAFSVDIKKDEENNGKAKITVSEKLDGSYYSDYSYDKPLESTIHMFDNVTLEGEYSEDAFISNDSLTYYPSVADLNTFGFDWKIGFGSVEIISDIKNENSATVNFVFTTEESMADDLKASAIAAVKTACGEYGHFSETDEYCKIAFSGSVAEITQNINAFIRANDPEYLEGKNYFEIGFTQTETPSKFTNSFSGTITYDLSPIIGNTGILFNDSEAFLSDYYYQGDFTTDHNQNRLSPSSGAVTFTLVKTSLLMIILTALFSLAFVVGIITAVAQRNKITELFKGLKKKSAENTTVPQPHEGGTAYASDIVDAAYVNQPVTAEADEQNTSPEETEELL